VNLSFRKVFTIHSCQEILKTLSKSFWVLKGLEKECIDANSVSFFSLSYHLSTYEVGIIVL